MKRIILAFIVLTTTAALAETARIHSVTDTFIKFEDGRVGFLDEVDSDVLNQIKPGLVIKFELDQDHILDNIEIDASKEDRGTLPSPSVTENYTPSVLRDYTYATNLLHSFRFPPVKDAQCYDKAHIWTYETEYNYRARLLKAWLFFADHYIERYRYKWWFHVAPLAKVMMRGTVEERILDREFYRHPLKLKLWTDLFMENKATCKEVTSYYDYSQRPGEDDCYVIRSTPYYWQPKDLEARARSGTEKTQYIRWEIIHAYKEGFGLNAN